MADTYTDPRPLTSPGAYLPYWLIGTGVSDRAVHLYACLAAEAQRRCAEPPSRRLMTAWLHCSIDSIDRALRELIHIGAISVVPTYTDDGAQAANDYIVHLHNAEGGDVR